jgi:hypothetical protein
MAWPLPKKEIKERILRRCAEKDESFRRCLEQAWEQARWLGPGSRSWHGPADGGERERRPEIGPAFNGVRPVKERSLRLRQGDVGGQAVSNAAVEVGDDPRGRVFIRWPSWR